jgi:hydroxymethylpyrimidine pyrophosphatase-like HAD family hydrolase
MEAGGVILAKNSNGEIDELNLVSDSEIERLREIERKLRENHPEVKLSVDSYGRRTDRAAEFKYMSDEANKRLIDFLEENDCDYSVSNVHLNFWCGEISKALGCEKLLEKFFPNLSKEDCIFFGDALNDESMFEHFPNTIGVANINKHLENFKFRPKVVLTQKHEFEIDGVLSYLQALK